jgi:hypothetical protein
MRWKKRQPRPTLYWRPWFAWRPVVIEDGEDKVWLEWIWRHDDRYLTLMGAFVSSFTKSRFRSDVHWCGANLERKGWP